MSNPINQALSELRAERDRLDAAIEALESASSALGAPAARARKGRGRRRKSAGAAKSASKAVSRPQSASKASTKRAPRGLLKKRIHAILKKSPAPLTAAQIRDRVARTKYPSKNRDSLYVAVFNQLKKDGEVRKSGTGYLLK